MANLSDEAINPVVIINRLTDASFAAAKMAGNFDTDEFNKLPVLYSSGLPAYSSASDNAVWMIVGDLNGEHVNYPEGEGVIIKWDDLTYAEDDMVKVVARQYAGYGVTAPGRLVKLCKPAASTTT